MKILHLPTATGGNSFGLSKAEKYIGLDSRVLYRFDGDLHEPYELLLSTNPKLISVFLGAIKFFLFEKKNYNLFHFNYGSTIINYPKFGINNLDLFLFKKDRVFVTYNGSDARNYYNQFKGKSIVDSEYLRQLTIPPKKVKIINKRIKRFAKIAKHNFFLNPDLKNFLPDNSSFIPYTIAHWDMIKNHPPVINNDRIKIVHAPTRRLLKGTNFITSAIKNLELLYPSSIEFILVENLSNDDAMNIYTSADLVIDQLIIGWYGAFSVECMKMGKPIMVYIHEEDLVHIPSEMAKDLMDSVFNTNIVDIQADIERIILNKQILLEYSQKSTYYVEKWHNPVSVAKLMNQYYLK